MEPVDFYKKEDEQSFRMSHIGTGSTKKRSATNNEIAYIRPDGVQIQVPPNDFLLRLANPKMCEFDPDQAKEDRSKAFEL